MTVSRENVPAWRLSFVPLPWITMFWLERSRPSCHRVNKVRVKLQLARKVIVKTQGVNKVKDQIRRLSNRRKSPRAKLARVQLPDPAPLSPRDRATGSLNWSSFSPGRSLTEQKRCCMVSAVYGDV